MSTLEDYFTPSFFLETPSDVVTSAIRDYEVQRLRRTYADSYLLVQRLVTSAELFDT
jgi:hypothetical protein